MVSTPAGDPQDKREIAFFPADSSGAKTLSREQVDFYNEHGYLHPLSIFSEREVVETCAYVDGLFQKLDNENGGRVTASASLRSGHQISFFRFCITKPAERGRNLLVFGCSSGDAEYRETSLKFRSSANKTTSDSRFIS